jgi:predicted metal-binding membrane protein
MSDAAIEAVLRRDRVIVAAAVVVLTALAWAYVWWLAADMDMGGMDMSDFRMIPAGMGLMMPATAPWTTTEFAFVFGMWAVMMIGMMTPSVTPMLLIYARVGREAVHQGKPLAASAYFAVGYLSPAVADSTAPRWPQRVGSIGRGFFGFKQIVTSPRRFESIRKPLAATAKETVAVQN